MPHVLSLIITNLIAFVLSITPVSSYSEGVVGQPNSFIPVSTVTDTDKAISKLIYRGLFKYDIYGEIIPDLAESWQVSDGGVVYTIKIRENQKWFDGSTITADDLIYTSYSVENLKGVATDKVDDRTVRYTLPNSFSPFLSLMTVGIMKQGSIEKDNVLKPTSSGPFHVVRVEKEGQIIKKVVLYNPEAKNIKKLVFKFYQYTADLALAAKLAEIHAYLQPRDTDFREIEGFTTYKYPIQSVYYSLFFNLRNDKFSKPEDREKFITSAPIQDLVQNLGIPVEGAVSKSPYTSENYKQDRYNEKLSYDLSPLAFTITIPEGTINKELVKNISKYWEQNLKVKIDLQEVSPENIRKDVIEPRNFEILLYGQEIGRDPDRYINWHSTQVNAPGLNLSGLNQVRADRALEEGRKAINFEDRLTHYNEFQKVIYEQNPAVFLYHPYMTYVVSKRVKGVGDKYTFTPVDRFLDFENWSF